MLGVTRVLLVLVILRHCDDPLPDHSFQVENLSRIFEASLFKIDHSQTKKGPPTWKRASTRVSFESWTGAANKAVYGI
jgi:hypothetical protein